MNINGIVPAAINLPNARTAADKTMETALSSVTASTEVLVSAETDTLSKMFNSLLAVVGKDNGLISRLPEPLAQSVMTAFSGNMTDKTLADAGLAALIRGQKLLLDQLGELVKLASLPSEYPGNKVEEAVAAVQANDIDTKQISGVHKDRQPQPEHGISDTTAGKRVDLQITNIPVSLQESLNGLKQDQLATIRMLSHLPPEELHNAVVILDKLTNLMENAFQQSSASGTYAGQTNILALPLLIGPDGNIPAYLHVYREQEKDDTGIPKPPDIWLRVSALTDNLGETSALFHLYQGNRLDIKINVAQAAGVQPFQAALDEIRQVLNAASFTPGNFTVAAGIGS